jgi:hypothetical protein
VRLIAITLAAFGFGAALPAASPAALTRCPKLPLKDGQHWEARKIRVANVTCRHATAIIRRWQGTNGPESECDTRAESCYVFDLYECVHRYVGEDSEVTCVRGARRVKFIDVIPG